MDLRSMINKLSELHLAAISQQVEMDTKGSDLYTANYEERDAMKSARSAIASAMGHLLYVEEARKA